MVRWQWFARDAEVRQAAHHAIAAAARAAIQARGAFHLVLAGGSTPRAVYASLCDLPTDWAAWHLYFGDERVLPAGHPERNSTMAQDAWLARTPIPLQQIHPMPTERGLEPACAANTQLLADVGEFDLVLLGLGEDGHTASLFPGHDIGAADDAPDVLMVHDAPKPPPPRLSLSAHRLSRARQVLFLVTGASKQEAVARWKSGEPIPAAAIHCPNGVDVLLDNAAWPKAHSP
jgi:6-phosphogluconolactonase